MGAVWAAVWLTGCGAKYYRNQADAQVYSILAQKHRALYDGDELYTIEKLTRDPLPSLERAAQPLLTLPPEFRQRLEPPLILPLAKALELAEFNSRTYQNEKEDVYLTALALTDARHDFSNRFSGLLNADWDKSPGDETIAGGGQVGVARLLKTGATIGLNLSTEFLKHLTGDPRRTAASILALNIIQPLWRGAGKDIATEDLKQAERDVIYAIREFARFKKTFAVQIAGAYYRVLQQRVVVRNERNNYENLRIAGDRAAMVARAGRLPEFQADQARQDELRAKDRWIGALKRYFELLDVLKLDLALPIDTVIDLDENDLEQLQAAGIVHPEWEQAPAIAIALDHRQDLLVERDRVDDAKRKVTVAVRDLGPDVDLSFSASLPSKPDTRYTEFDTDDATYNAGLDVDLPFDRLTERNAYRRALIVLDRAKRELGRRTDQVKLDVRNAWRTLQQARQSYIIQQNSVALAGRRVDSTTLLLQAGRADTRDLLEARAALVESQNALVRALTDHTIARLEFYRDLGLLDVRTPEQWLYGAGAGQKGK